MFANSLSPPNRSFSLRTLLAVTSGVAFVAFVAQWMLSVGGNPLQVGLFLSPWASGSFCGILVMRLRGRSTLLGAVVGGVTGTAVFPGVPFFCSFVFGLHGVNSLWWLGILMIWSMVGNALLAVVVGILNGRWKASID